MHKLDLDFNIQRRHAAWPGWALLLIGLALWGEMGFSFIKLHQEMSGLENILLKDGMAGRTAPRQGSTSYTPEEFVQAQQTITRISIPWGALFKAVESVKLERVALLALEPDPKAGTLLLRGEAGDLPDLLTYIARLEKSGQLHDIYLVRHEIGQGGNSQRPVTFSISAGWEPGS